MKGKQNSMLNDTLGMGTHQHKNKNAISICFILRLEPSKFKRKSKALQYELFTFAATQAYVSNITTNTFRADEFSTVGSFVYAHVVVTTDSFVVVAVNYLLKTDLFR